MRNHVLYSAVGMALLFLAGGCQKPVVEPPVLTMSTTEYTAPAAGGNVTVAYKVANPVEGTTVKVVGAEKYSWVEVTGVSPNVVLAVEANDTEAERTAELTLSYAGAADKCEFTLVQAAGEGGDEPGSDAERLEMSYSTLYVYTAEGPGGEDNYFLSFSDMPFDADGYPSEGATVVLFDIYATAGTNGALPTGTYVYDGEDSYGPMTFTSISNILTPEGENVYFSEGTIEVSDPESDGFYDLMATVTGRDGAAYSIVYSGIISEEGGDVPGAGHDYVLTEFEGIVDEGYGVNGEDCYYMVLSDLPLIDGEMPQPGGVYYSLEFYAEAGSGYNMPEGTYTFGAEGATDPMTLANDWNTYFMAYYEDGTYEELTFTGGEVTLTKDGDIYNFEGNLTDENGDAHHFVYSGPAYSSEPEPTPDAIEIEATLATALYYSDSDGVMNVTMQFTDMTPDAEGYVYPPGSLLQLDVYMPYNEDGRIATGIYDVTEMGGEEYTVATYYSSLTYSPDANTDFSEYGLRSGGTVEISGSPDFGLYNVTCDLVTEDGIPVKCTYEGYLEVSGMSMTTLTGDYELDLEGATGMAAYYGDAYGTGGANWMFALSSSPAGGDEVQVELVGEAADFEAGIPSGEYKPMASDLPSPGEYVPGFIFDNTLYGSWYICTDAQDNIVGYAPAVDGTVKVVNNGDGTYDITFDCVDDAGNVWDGSWTGAIETLDYSQASSYSVKSAKPAGKTLDAKELKPVEEKSEFMNANGLKLAKVQAQPQKESFRLSRMGR